MPQTSAAVSTGDTVKASDHNTCVTDLAELFGLVYGSATTTVTISGRKVTQLDWATGRLVFNYSATTGRVTTVALQPAGGGTAIYTWTPTYTGRAITSWARA